MSDERSRLLEDAEQLLDWSDHVRRVEDENLALAERGELMRRDVERASEGRAVLDMLTSVFRRTHFPRSGRVIVAATEVFVLSARGTRAITVPAVATSTQVQPVEPRRATA